MAQTQRELGDVATRLLSENDRVKIWEMDLAPGERSAIHEHALDYMVIVIDGDKIALQPEHDTISAYHDYVEVDVTPGYTSFLPKGGIETAINVGTRRYHEIVIELKD